MAAKGPNTGMGGINVKSGKSKSDNLDFDALMQTLLSDNDETEEENNYISLEQNKKQLSETEQKQVEQSDQQTLDLLNQMIQSQKEDNAIYIPVTPPVNEIPLQQPTAVANKKFNIDPTKPFNQQQPRKGTNQRKITEELPTQSENVALNIEKTEENFVPSLENVQNTPINTQSPQGRASKFKGENIVPQLEEEIEDEEDTGRSKKKGKNTKKPSKNKNTKTQNTTKPEPISNDEKLKKKGFPKKYYDPTDAETDPATGETEYYFNIEKTLRNHNMLWITKLIPLNTLDRLTYDKKPLDEYAKKQHEKAVRLNNSTPKEQYQYESRNKMMKFLAGAGALAACVLYVIFGAIPNNNYENALDLYAQEDWENAQQAFIDLGNYKNSKYYGKYSEAMTKLIAKDYDAAKADFTLLLNYQEYFNVSIEDAVKNCDYQKAIRTYSEGNFRDAMKIFATIADFQESKMYYYKCGYEIADDYYEAGDLPNALDSFYKVRAYEDAGQRLSEIADQLYNAAMLSYSLEEYPKSREGFTFLSKYNYKESKSMIEQCYYREGLNKYLAGNYEEARQLFTQVVEYKDSNAMYKECTYKIAKIKYAESIESSLKEYASISEYRDVPTILSQGVFNIFGEWEIVEMNGSKTTPVKFKFNEGGLFQTNKSVLYVAISTDATPIQYKWNGEKYTTLDGTYTLSAKAIDEKTMLLTCTEPGKTVNFTCLRQASYLTMLNNNTISPDNPESPGIDKDDPSTDQTITTILQKYVDSKTDGTAIIGGEEINCLLIIQQINDNLGQANPEPQQ